MPLGQELMWFYLKTGQEKVDLIFRGWEFPAAALVTQACGSTAQSAYTAMLELTHLLKWIELYINEKVDVPRSLFLRQEVLQTQIQDALSSDEVALIAPFGLNTPAKLRQSLLDHNRATKKALSTEEFHAEQNPPLAARPLDFASLDFMNSFQPPASRLAPFDPLQGLPDINTFSSPISGGASIHDDPWGDVSAAPRANALSGVEERGEVFITRVDQGTTLPNVDLSGDAPSAESDKVQQLLASLSRMQQREATYQDITHLFATEPKRSVDWCVPLSPVHI